MDGREKLPSLFRVGFIFKIMALILPLFKSTRLAALRGRPWFKRMPKEGVEEVERMARELDGLKSAVKASEHREIALVTRIAACAAGDYIGRLSAARIFQGEARQNGAHSIPDNGGVFFRPNIAGTDDDIVAVELARPASPETEVMVKLSGAVGVRFHGSDALTIIPRSSNEFTVKQRPWFT